MVKTGEFVAFAANLKPELKLGTEMSCIKEMAERVLALEAELDALIEALTKAGVLR